MKYVVASPNPTRAANANIQGGFGMALYHAGTHALAGLGHTLPHAAARDLPQPPPVRAWDFLSLSLAVFGADRFLLRKEASDAWTRQIALEVDVVEPDVWNSVSGRLAAALRFLTGDIWFVNFRADGARPPNWHPQLSDRDCACLFSGGLDSFIGAADLLQMGSRPLLVSQASPKEGGVQEYLAGKLGLNNYRFEGKAIEKHGLAYEPSSRARSILFIGYGVVAASALPNRGGSAKLVIPENGLISINPPLTRRRVGSASTRTTHPHFISELQEILRRVGLNIDLVNPYGNKTKGEMLEECQNGLVAKLAHNSYSCGKGKRLNMHCGRCIPCLIRRAAFKKAKLRDNTKYWAPQLASHAKNDDVLAARLASEQLRFRNLAQWTSEAGPLPINTEQRASYVDVVRRGLGELKRLVDSVSWP